MKTTRADVSVITGWHAHIYFTPDEIETAQGVCEAARDLFGIEMGRVHVAPVGPHPTGSCQLSVPAEKFAGVASWLTLNRNGLTVFIHAETGDAMADHTQHVMWLGDSQNLRMDVLSKLVSRD